jgi:UMF1 family MFS transporter
LIVKQRDIPWWQVLIKYSIFEAADSSWSLIIVSTYFGTFLQAVLKERGASFGWAVTLGALVIAILSPVLGASADHTGRRQPYLRFFVFGVTICTAALAWSNSVSVALPLFTLAYICAHGAFTFFSAMIPAVSNHRNVSAIVSITVGVGYAGGLICLLTLSRVAPVDELAGQVFLPMAAIYLVLAFPAMFFAPDFPRKPATQLDFRAAYHQLTRTFEDSRKHTYLFRFLIADFFYENAVASVITLMGLYARNVMGFKASELTALFGPAIIVAMLSAWFVFGPLVRLIGPKRAVLIDLLIWLMLFCSALIIKPSVSLAVGSLNLSSKSLFALIVAPLAGVGLAGVWSSSRVLLTALAPVEESGKFWGLYNLSGRSASVIGDATWSFILTVFGEQIFGYQVAILALSIYVIMGAILVSTLPDVRPSRNNFLHVS